MSEAVNPALGDEVLERCARLPLKPAAVVLEGRFVRLEPLDLSEHLEALHAISNGEAIRIGARETAAYDAEAVIWRYMFNGPFANAAALGEALKGQIEAANGLALCVIDRTLGHPVGVVNYMNNVPSFLKIELGSIWYSPLAQRTNANLEATYLMLEHAFGLGYRRVEWKCDALNARSRKSALRMGFQFEGIQEAHMIVKGRNRDTAWFRMLEWEWPAAKVALEKLLARNL